MKGPFTLSTIASTALALAMIATVLLCIFGARLIRSDRQRGLLMIAAGIVIFANVLIWTL